MLKVRQNFENFAGDLKPLFDRLIAVRVCSELHPLRDIARLRRFSPQLRRAIFSFEEPRRGLESLGGEASSEAITRPAVLSPSRRSLYQ
jgi:hypothetical protein